MQNTAFAAVLAPTSRFAAHATLSAVATRLDVQGSLTTEEFLRILDQWREAYPAGLGE